MATVRDIEAYVKAKAMRPKRICTHPIRMRRRQEAKLRQAERYLRSPEEQLVVLNGRLGAQGAERERARLVREIVAEN